MNNILINNNLKKGGAAILTVQERGFRFGDGVFETVAVRLGVPYLWEYHLERLRAGLQALRINAPTDTLLPQVLRLLAENKVNEGVCRIYISRGKASQGYLPLPCEPTIVIETALLPEPMDSMALWLSAYEKISPQALPTHCKLAQGVNPALARMEAADHGCQEALQLDAHKHIAEASSANIFWLKEGKLHTPSLVSGALAGVTRRWLMEHAPFPVAEGLYVLADLQTAEAAILTNATRGIVAVEALQPQGCHWDSHGLARRLTALRQQHITEYARTFA